MAPKDPKTGKVMQHPAPGDDEEQPITTQDVRLVRRAIKEGWITRQRWPTKLSAKELEDSLKGKQPDLIEKTIKEAHRKLDDVDGTGKLETMRLILSMESMNQRDQLAYVEPPDKGPDPQVFIENLNVIMEQARDSEAITAEFYDAARSGAISNRTQPGNNGG